MTEPPAVDFEKVKQNQQRTWSSGDYGRIAWLTSPLGDVLCESVDLRPGCRVLDVATGTGHVALAAARRFCDTTGIDYVPSLLAAARQRAAAEALEVEFTEADAEKLPYGDGSFDYVLSAIGVMFTADHRRAARELLRVCRPSGTIGLLSWTPTGFVGELLKTVGRHVAPPSGVTPPPKWGTEDYIRSLFGDQSADIRFHTGQITERFPSAEFFADFFLTHYGPTLRAAESLDGTSRDAFRADLVDLARRATRTTDGTVVCGWEFQVAVATRN